MRLFQFHDRFRMRAFAVFSLVMAVVLTSLAVPLGVGADNTTTWRGEYYNSVNLSGIPALTRDDANIDFNWGGGSPGAKVNADRFSVRWTRFVSFDGGSYVFRVSTDDGVRFWVDDQLVIDQWHDQALATFSATKQVSAGYHSLRLEYYENVGNAVIKLWWEGSGAANSGWRGEYYGNTSLGGSPIVRDDAAINFDWGTGAPIAGVGSDYFSVRWTRQADFPSSGNHTFSATVDDGVRVWVDGTLIIDKWYPQSRTTHQATRNLAAGSHQVKVEYFESTGQALCIVNWALAGSTTTTTEIVVDDLSGHFVRGGSGTWYARSVGYRGHLFWAWNSQSALRNWARWYPYVSAPGNWEVYVYVAGRYFGSKSARYSVYHNGVRNDRVVVQNDYYDKWVSLGTYYFAGGSGEYVYLGGNTGETTATRFVGFDAVRFVRRDTAPPVTGCSIVPILGFGRIWNGYSSVRGKLGCATATEGPVWAGEATFQGGVAFWRQDSKKIYVLYNDGSWQTYDDTWTPSEPEWDPGLFPPAGYYQPKRGFGKVWRNNARVRNGLGWATSEERGFTATTQSFQNGLMLWSNVRGIYVLYNDGRWERFS